jgi:Lar family restriction alleviation protein
MSEKLKPCPFCGSENKYNHGEVRIHQTMATNYYAVCENPKCEIKPRTKLYQWKKDATKAWNRRAN